MKILRLDFETYSDVDIKKSGMHKYCRSPKFEIMLFGYMYIIDGVKQPVIVIDILNGEEVPDEVLNDLTNPDVTKTAYNAPFEIESIECYFGIKIDVRQWVCTRIKAGMLGLPMNLEAVGKVLKFDDTKQKIADGKRLIRYFTMPVAKPSKKDGLRTRNFPAHDIEAWKRFKEYNAQDIISEDAIADKIDFFTIPPQEMELWYLDHKINSRGIMLDETMFESAIAIYERFQQEMLDETAEIAGINNPNSRAQLVTWLRSMMDCEVEGLTKADIPILLANTDNVDVIRVLELRKQIAKTSIKKYYSMRSVICEDGRARGLIQFYGANRTGRFAGRLIQVQNLVKNFLVSLGLAREVVRNGEWWILELLYDNIPDTLAQLIRTAFVPINGNEFFVSDYAAIEARVAAWVAKEQWRIDLFAESGAIYEASASKMFKVSLESISYLDENNEEIRGPNYHMRAKGKITELACIGENQHIITDKGTVYIQDVTPEHKVWDGFEFVSHDGLIFKGIKEVITYEGLTATPDHLVWVDGQSKPIEFGVAAKSSYSLQRSSPYRKSIRLGRNNIRRKKMESQLAASNSINQMQRRMQQHPVDGLPQHYNRQIKRLSSLLSTSPNTKMAGSKVNSSKTALRKYKRQRISALRGERNRISFRFHFRSRIIHPTGIWRTRQRFGIGSKRQRRALRERKFEVCTSACESSQSQNNANTFLESGRVAVFPNLHSANAGKRLNEDGNNRDRRVSRKNEKKELAFNPRKVKVYDILNCGPNSRFTVNGVLVHNCGYQGGWRALINMGAVGMGVCKDAIEVGKEVTEIHALQWEDQGDGTYKWIYQTHPFPHLEYTGDLYTEQFLNQQGVFISWSQAAEDWYIQKELEKLIVTWREENPNIVNCWKDLNEAAINAVRYNTRVELQYGIAFFMEKGVLFMRLPSGRCLSYMWPKLAPNSWGKPSLSYEGMNQTTGKWERIATYGGKIFENLVQAIARDCLAVSLLKLDKAGYEIVMHVHDEVVIDAPPKEGRSKEIESIMAEPIDWAPGLYLPAVCKAFPYYQKD